MPASLQVPPPHSYCTKLTLSWPKSGQHLTTTSSQVVVQSNKESQGRPFLQAKQSQVSQLLLINLTLQTLHQLCHPSLDTLQQDLNVLPAVKGPELDTALKVWPHQRQVQGKNHFPDPAGHKISDTSQDAAGLLGYWAHCWLMFSHC